MRCSILVVRAFARMRELLASNRELADRVDQLEARLDQHDEERQAIVEAIRQLAASPVCDDRHRIGSTVNEESGRYVVHNKG